MNKVYVGNLPFKSVEADLEEMFAACGSITKVNVVRDRETGRSRGFAFIEFDTESSAQNAVDQLNGKEVEGRPLRVNIAKEQERTGGGAGRGGRPGGDRGGRPGGDRGGRGGDRGGRY